MKEWAVTIDPTTYSLINVKPAKDLNLVTSGGTLTMFIEADTKEEAVEKGPKHAMLKEIERLREERSRRWKKGQEENERQKEATEESLRVIKKFYTIIRGGRLEIYCDGKSIHVEWYSPEGLRKAEMTDSVHNLLKNLVDTISEAPLDLVYS